MLRVDQAGEYGATRIYAGQLAVMGDRPPTQPRDRAMAAQEERHRAHFDALIARRGVRPTALQPFWKVAGFALGAATALIGPEAAMACTAAVETEIDDHYRAAARRAGRRRSRTFRDDRGIPRRRRRASRRGARRRGRAAPAYPLLSGAIRLGCRAAIAPIAPYLKRISPIMRALILALILSAALCGTRAFAQSASNAARAPASGPSDNEKVKQVFVYGERSLPPEQPATRSSSARACRTMNAIRIPKELRTDPNRPQVQSWANRARSIEYVGAEGINSCSPTGAGGFTGCFAADRARKPGKSARRCWAAPAGRMRSPRRARSGWAISTSNPAQIEAKAKAEEEEAAQREAAQEAREKAVQQGPATPQP